MSDVITRSHRSLFPNLDYVCDSLLSLGSSGTVQFDVCSWVIGSNLPDFLHTFNLNPFEVTNKKVVLVHEAELESTIPFIKTKLCLERVVVNVAGKSQNLDPAGANILSINVPFGEFLNSGTFDTTYMDDDLHISRSKVGVVDQLRVFVRPAPRVEKPVVEEEALVEDEEEIDSPSDVRVEEAEIVSEMESEEEIDSLSDVEEAEIVNEVEDKEETDSPSDIEGAEIASETPAESSVDEGDEYIEAPSGVKTED